MFVTIYDIAQYLGVTEHNGEEYARVRLPMLGGCNGCGATLACYNMYPTYSGYVKCLDCVVSGFASVEEAIEHMFPTKPKTVVVTRHKALVEYLKEIGLADDTCQVIEHATPKDVKGKVVVGVLPLRLAALAVEVIEVPMDIPAELRGVELNIEQVREFAGQPVTYKVEVKL